MFESFPPYVLRNRVSYFVVDDVQKPLRQARHHYRYAYQGKIEENNYEVIIAGAGLAAHLPGVIASKTILPVIGVPISASNLDGMDALLSIVQMPKPITVATVGINNSYNAGMLAVEMLALKYSDIKNKLIEFRRKMKEDFIADNEKPIEFDI